MPTLTHEQDALKQAALAITKSNGKTVAQLGSEYDRYQALAYPAAILALLAQIEASQAPSEICFGPHVPLVEYVQPKLEWGDSEPVPSMDPLDRQSVDQARVLSKGCGAPVDKRADNGVRFFTAIYEIPNDMAGEVATELCGRPYWTAGSWSHALNERNAARAALRQPVQAAPDGWRDLIEWLLGKNGKFPTRDSSSEGLYWWRKELRARYEKLAGAVPGEAQ